MDRNENDISARHTLRIPSFPKAAAHMMHGSQVTNLWHIRTSKLKTQHKYYSVIVNYHLQIARFDDICRHALFDDNIVDCDYLCVPCCVPKEIRLIVRSC